MTAGSAIVCVRGEGGRHADNAEGSLASPLARNVPAVSIPVAILSDEWATAEAVPLPDVARAANAARRDLQNAVSRGYLHPVPGRVGKYGAVLLPRDEIEAVFTAVAIAAAAGIVFATALRVALAGATLPATDTTA